MSHYEGDDVTGRHLWLLREGDRIRAREGGPVVTIYRVNDGAAYFKTIEESTYEVFDTEIGDHKEITRSKSKSTYIAPSSFVEMIERGPMLTENEKWALTKETAPPPNPKDPRPELPPVKYQKARRRR